MGLLDAEEVDRLIDFGKMTEPGLGE